MEKAHSSLRFPTVYAGGIFGGVPPDHDHYTNDHSNILVLGGGLIALLLATILFGIITVQASAYFHKFKDNTVTQILVLALLVIQFTTVVQIADLSYMGLIHMRGRSIHALELLIARLPGIFFCGVIEALLVQTFFIFRIWAISKSFVRTILVTVPVLGQMGLGTTLVGLWEGGANHDVSEGAVYAVFLGWLICQIIADFGIATTISLLLLKKKAEIKTTNSLLNKLVIFTMSTGALTGVFSIIFAIMLKVTANSRSTIVILVSTCGGIYAFAMLANIHTRSYVKKWEQKRGVYHDGPSAHRSGRPTQSEVVELEPLSITSSLGKERMAKKYAGYSSGENSTDSGTASSGSRSMERLNAFSRGVVVNITHDSYEYDDFVTPKHLPTMPSQVVTVPRRSDPSHPRLDRISEVSSSVTT